MERIALSLADFSNILRKRTKRQDDTAQLRCLHMGSYLIVVKYFNVFQKHEVLYNAYRVFATFLLEKLNSDGNKIRFCWTQKE